MSSASTASLHLGPFDLIPLYGRKYNENTSPFVFVGLPADICPHILHEGPIDADSLRGYGIKQCTALLRAGR